MSTIKKLAFGTKLGYGIGSIGEGLAYNAFYVYFIYFLTDFVGIAPGVAGTISLFAIIWDAVTDPLIGYFSDRIDNPKGKRRSFMMKAFIPLGAVIFLLFTSWPGLSGGLQIAYFLVVNTLFWLFFTTVDIPYMTLGGELSSDEGDRLSLRSFGTAGYYIGFLMASSGVTLVLEAFAGSFGGDYIKAWSWVGVLVGVITAVAYYVCICAVKGKETYVPKSAEEKKNSLGFMATLKHIFSIKPYWYLLGYDFFCNLGIMFFTTCQMYVFNSYVGMTSNQIAIAYAVYVLFIVILSPIYPRLVTKKSDKKTMLAVTLAIAAIGQIAFIVLPVTFVGVLVILFTNALTMTGFYVYSYAMLYDTGEVSVLKTGHNLEGMFMSGYQFVYKFGTAISMWLVGIFLTIYEYDAAAEVLSQFTLNGIRSMASWLPGVMLLLGVPFVILYNLPTTTVDRLKGLLKRRENGEDVPAAEYEKIL